MAAEVVTVTGELDDYVDRYLRLLEARRRRDAEATRARRREAAAARRAAAVHPATSTVAADLGVTESTIHRYIESGLLRPVAQRGRGSGCVPLWRWRPVDLAAARTVIDVVGTGKRGTAGPAHDLARLAADAVYRHWGRAPWVVVALPDHIHPAADPTAAVTWARRYTVATLVRLEVGDAPGGPSRGKR